MVDIGKQFLGVSRSPGVHALLTLMGSTDISELPSTNTHLIRWHLVASISSLGGVFWRGKGAFH